MSKIAQLMQQAAAGAGGSPAAEFIDGTASSGVSSLSTSALSGTQAGDVYIAALMDDNYIDFIDAPSGWAGMTSSYPEEDSINSIQHIVASGTTSGTVEAEHPQGGDPHVIDAIGLVAFRNIGTRPSTPSATISEGGSTFNLPSMTVSEAGSTAVIIAMIDDDFASVTGVTGGYTIAVQNGRFGGSMAIMYKLNLPVGSTGTTTGYWSSSDALYTIGYIIPPPA